MALVERPRAGGRSRPPSWLDAVGLDGSLLQEPPTTAGPTADGRPGVRGTVRGLSPQQASTKG